MNLYEKIVTLGASFRASLRQKADVLDFAPLFSPGSSYAPGRLVVYEDKLYVCNAAHSGAWDPDDFALATVDDAVAYRARLMDIAPEFVAEADYEKDDLVIRNGKLQKCSSPGKGSVAEFSDASVEDAIESIRADLKGDISDLQADMALKAALADLAPGRSSSPSINYVVGQLVVDGGSLKLCSVAGTGATAVFVPATVMDAISLVRDALSYSSTTQTAASTETDIYNVVLKDRTFNTVNAFPYGENASIVVTMPTVPAPSGQPRKVVDVLLRVDTDDEVPSLVFDTASHIFLPTDKNPNWHALIPNSYNIFTFTFAGMAADERLLWVVGRVTYDMETAS